MIGLNSKDPAVRLTAVKDLGESDNPDIQLRLTELTDPASEADSEVRAKLKSR